jgi:UDP-N-acetylglucosamine 2-epimerase
VPKISMVLGIRPDVIRASLIIRNLKSKLGKDFEFIWSGQHYSDNMKDIFFRQLEVPPPDVELKVDTTSDGTLIGSLGAALHEHLSKSRPEAVVFLGDTNTVTSCLVVAALNIPIVHIEGCMRSYDWRMPEEKYRTAIDHLADVIYAYVDEYKEQGLAEGLDPSRIIVTGNPIVDVLEHYFISGKVRLNQEEKAILLDSYNYSGGNLWTLTCHRRENIENRESLKAILDLAGLCPGIVAFPAGYKTQAKIREFDLLIPENTVMTDPIGYAELMELLSSSVAVLTDSGTVVEEAAVLGISSIQMRTSTERPQVYDFGGSVRFDPHGDVSKAHLNKIIRSAEDRYGGNWVHDLGDGLASQRITDDLIRRLQISDFSGHRPNPKLRPVARNYGHGIGDKGLAR